MIEGDTLQELFDEGHKTIPTQWIEVDRNAHLRAQGKQAPPDLKSRLVGCGQFEDVILIMGNEPGVATTKHGPQICRKAASV